MSDPKKPARRAFDPRLLEGSIPRALFLLAVPIMGANILQVAYQVIDAFWVGRLGAAAIASARLPSASNFQPVIFVLGNQPRSSEMIFGVGTSSTSSFPKQVESFFVDLISTSLCSASGAKTLPNA